MKSFVLVSVMWLACGASAFAQVSVGVDTGFREDYMRWNIAGDINGQNPNIVSELTWENLVGAEVVLGGQLLVGNFFAEVDAALVNYQSGNNQDSDYLEDNRANEFLRSNGDGLGDAEDLSVAVGYRWTQPFFGYPYQLAARAGYSQHTQALTIQDSTRTIDTLGVAGGEGAIHAGLNSTYNGLWNGPWLGLEAARGIGETPWWAVVRLRVQDIEFYGYADWILRTDFQHPKSFEQWGSGYGWGMNAEVAREQWLNWTLRAGVDYRSMSTRPGIVRFHRTVGGAHDQQFNEAVWEVWRLYVGLSHSF